MDCGLNAVAHLDIFEAVAHDIQEEADDFPAVVGLLAYDLGEGWWLVFDFGLGFCCEHVFYCNAGGWMGSTGGWRGWGWCGVTFYSGSQVTLGFARGILRFAQVGGWALSCTSTQGGFETHPYKMTEGRGWDGRLTGLCFRGDLRLSQLPGNRTG